MRASRLLALVGLGTLGAACSAGDPFMEAPADTGAAVMDTAQDARPPDAGTDTGAATALDAPPTPDAADAARDAPVFGDASYAQACARCATNDDCGPEGRCATLSGGARACLPVCNPDVPVCPGGLRCVLDLALSSAAVCAPVGGVCCVDGDGDGYGRGVGCRDADCDDGDATRRPGAVELCNGRDDDCDGTTDEALARACMSACGMGMEACAAGAWGACSARAPAASETCGNGVDDDCNGRVDDGCTTTPPVTLCADGPRVESAAGDYVVLANYDGGRLVLDVDVPVRSIGIIAYEPLDVVLMGSAVGAVTRVHVVGYNSMTATVSGVPAGVVQRAGMPMATRADPAGNARMVCASTCRPGTMPGGCNTLDQVLDYFGATLGGTRRWWHMQYGTFSGGSFRVSRGGCCV